MSRRKSKEPPSELEEALAAVKRDAERRNKCNLEDFKELRKEFREVIDCAKRETEELEKKKAATKPLRTRSGLRRGAPKKKLDAHTNGHIVNKGMNDVEELFDKDEQSYLKKQVREIKQVKDLGYHHLRYLIRYEFLKDLTKIKEGHLQSDFHKSFHNPQVSKEDLRSEIRTSLFTNDQRDYINGYLQGIFEANKQDSKGNLRHKEIEYVAIVMLYETILRIVKLVHRCKTSKQAAIFMKTKSREALGISDDDDDF